MERDCNRRANFGSVEGVEVLSHLHGRERAHLFALDLWRVNEVARVARDEPELLRPCCTPFATCSRSS